jgi:hypothetical protein
VSRGWNLLDALAEHATAAHDVSNFTLITVHLDRTRPKEIGRRVQIQKLCFHVFS